VHLTLSTEIVRPTLPKTCADVQLEEEVVLDDDEEVLFEVEVVLDEESEVVGVVRVPEVTYLVAALKAEPTRAQAPMQSTSKTPREISTHLSLPLFFGCCGGG
jgi:hypothetical protein